MTAPVKKAKYTCANCGHAAGTSQTRSEAGTALNGEWHTGYGKFTSEFNEAGISIKQMTLCDAPGCLCTEPLDAADAQVA